MFKKNFLMGDFSKGSSSEFAKAKLRDSDKFVVEGPGLGPVNRATLVRDPKHLGFTLSRYKFISKMFFHAFYYNSIHFSKMLKI